MHIELEKAEKAVAAARKEAISLKTKMCIAVVDSGANLRAFVRMDDAWVGSIDIAIKKAKTACFFTMGSGELGKLSQPGMPLYGIEHSNNGLITFPGGLPILQNDRVNNLPTDQTFPSPKLFLETVKFVIGHSTPAAKTFRKK